ncbi:MAG: [LysW]-lysine hydrolase [Thermomicrobiales bacterium]|nr:[LysW]-lysine hydrolase [Thermomicrobiales bacterium]
MTYERRSPVGSPSLSSDTTATDQQSIDLLHGLVGIQSLSGQETQAVEWLTAQMTALGLDAHIDDAGNAVGVKGSGPTSIVLLGHIDTVPGDIPVRIDDGVLHGRGAVDAKGPLATFVAAAAAASGINATITVVGAVGEESIGSLGANHVKHWPAPDLCIIGEPSGWDQVCLGYRGTISFEYLLRQDSRHTAGPGESVAEQAVGFWNGLTGRLAEIDGDLTGFNAIGPGLRSFNTAGDGLHDEAHLSVGLRLPPAVHSEVILPIIDELAGNATITLLGVQEGYQTNKRSRLTPPFLRAIRAQGGTPRFTRKLGTSDMTVVGPVWQCPIVAYGPGDSSLDHTPEERIVLDDYLKAVRILTDVLNDL